MKFLQEYEKLDSSVSKERTTRQAEVFLGKGSMGLEIMVCEAEAQPSNTELKDTWRKRQDGRATPVLLVVLHNGKATLCGPVGSQPPIYPNLEQNHVENICRIALSEIDRHSAIRFLRDALPSIDTAIPGLKNEGFLASHELRTGVTERPDWEGATEKAMKARKYSGKELIHQLGFDIQAIHNQLSVLLTNNKKVAVAAFLEAAEIADLASDRFSDMTPISFSLACADRENLPYVVVVAKRSIRLYPVSTGVGVGRRGRTETYVEIQLDVLPEEKSAYLWYIFSGEGLSEKGCLDEIIERSNDYAADLGKRLRERVYDQVIPSISTAIAETQRIRNPTISQLRTTYQMAMTTLFRLLFVAYAEDKELLPYRTNELYRSRSLKRKAHELQIITTDGRKFDKTTTLWEEVTLLFKAIEKGHPEWGVPAYDGGLFSGEKETSPIGYALSKIDLENEVFGPILAGLLLDRTEEGIIGPVDFRSLGVREFGTIYEGLLESELAIAETDLVIGKDDRYRPAKANERVAKPKGSIYLTDASGSRKALGSFFTKSFAVDHLLNNSLEPRIEEHLSRLDKMSVTDAAKSFFDLRIADIAMGSGHFLVSAIDRLERHFSNYLISRPLPGVIEELDRLRESATRTLERVGEETEIEDIQLLRRQIARRCIYGVDLNPLAVDLARLSIWIHTFVPGLPLSLLDHHLVCGNSLVGIATSQESKEMLGKGAALDMFDPDAKNLMKRVAEMMEGVGLLNDASASEVSQARKDLEKAQRAVAPWTALMDILAASRLHVEIKNELPQTIEKWLKDPNSILGSKVVEHARKLMEALPPFHFQTTFPDVFWRDDPGFDVIVGNPPWEEATIEEDDFWTRYHPGFQGLAKQADKDRLRDHYRMTRPDLVEKLTQERETASIMRRALVTGPFKGMGTGDPDLYKAFCWRFWFLLRARGRIGVVLPRSAFAAEGSTEFRKELFNKATFVDLTFLLNAKHWVFDGVEVRYTIALCSFIKTKYNESKRLPVRGPFDNMDDYLGFMKKAPVEFPLDLVLDGSDSATIPLMPTEEVDKAIQIMVKMRKHPKLGDKTKGSWRAIPRTEFHATHDRPIMKLNVKVLKSDWPVFTGESFNIWQSDTGSYFAHIDPRVAMDKVQEARMRRACNSPFYEMPEEWNDDPKTLPNLHPRIAFRDVTNRTNTRTLIAALVPPGIALTNKAPYLLWPVGDEKDQAYLLGILCSIPLDWYARRYVETNVNFFIFNPFPIPRMGRENILWKRVVQIAGRLASVDKRMKEWSKSVGVDFGPISDDKKRNMILELDALALLSYGLSEDGAQYMFKTFHDGSIEGAPWEERWQPVRTHYVKWKERIEDSR